MRKLQKNQLQLIENRSCGHISTTHPMSSLRQIPSSSFKLRRCGASCGVENSQNVCGWLVGFRMANYDNPENTNTKGRLITTHYPVCPHSWWLNNVKYPIWWSHNPILYTVICINQSRLLKLLSSHQVEIIVPLILNINIPTSVGTKKHWNTIIYNNMCFISTYLLLIVWPVSYVIWTHHSQLNH
jgi:hypothetical protein